jgi:hypothetical protein
MNESNFIEFFITEAFKEYEGCFSLEKALNTTNFSFSKGALKKRFELYASKYISEDDIGNYFSFIGKLPKSEWKQVSSKLWEAIYNHKVLNEYYKQNNELNKSKLRGNKDISRIIDSDIKKLKDCREVLFDRLFKIVPYHIAKPGIAINKTGKLEALLLWKLKKPITFNLKDAKTVLDLIIEDLETKEFRYISKESYYQKELPSLRELKKYLIEVFRKNNTPNYTDDINHLLSFLTGS